MPSEERSLSRVEGLFADWLAASRGASAVPFEAFVARHPADTAALQALKAEWDRLQAILRQASLGGPRALEELQARFGSEVDPGVSLQGERPAEEPASGPSSELLTRLRAHAPASSRYRILGEIGRGGMGAVLRIWDEDLRRASAMKVVLGRDEASTGTPAVDGRTLGRFLEEAQITGQLDHPGIVPVHELGLGSDGRVYFTMRLVKGEDLRTVFGHVKTGHDGWNPTRALSVLLKVCEAMAYAHDKRVIHRDLKPANVMVGRYGEVYVMDWGLARVLGQPDRHDLRLAAPASSRSVVRTERQAERAETPDSPLVTMDGTVMGTPAYMPPEQARGELEALGAHSDVYAVGAMLYELLTGRMPYVPDGVLVSPRVILARLLEEPPRPLAALAPRAPAELVAICEKAMARAPGERYPDMKALAADLRAYLERRVVKAYESGTWAETKKWVQRNKPLAAAMAGIVLVAAAGAFAFARKAEEATEQALEATLQARLASEREAEATRLRNEAIAKDRESRLRGLIQELEYFDTLDDDVYTYARLETRPAHEWWLERAHELVDGVPDGDPGGRRWSPGLADVRAALEELRRNALPSTPEEIERDRTSHPRAEELATKRAEATWMARMLGEEPWPSDSEVEAMLAKQELPTDASGLNELAWPLVAPDSRVFGREVEAVALARRAVESAGDEERAMYRDTLGWALLWAGELDEALEQERGALEEVGAEERAEYEGYLRRMQSVAQSFRDGSAAAGRAALRAEVSAIEAEVSARRTWTFAKSEDTWWERELVVLMAGLERLRRNIELAETSVRGGEAQARWREAIEAIAESESYRGVRWPSGERLTPQLGLLPIGPDPESGLWEFAHLATGAPAKRGADRKIQLDPGMGLVLVLLPGGRVPIAANPDDGQDASLTEIDLDPFFLSKHEMTAARWARIGGWRRPGRERRDSLLPAADLSWDDCRVALGGTGWLRLPSEAQWELGCRARTTTTWWPGDRAEDLRGVANIKTSDGPGDVRRIGELRANLFGLHDVHGNVWEWCLDALSGDRELRRAGDALLDEPDAADRVLRGGAHWSGAAKARSSALNGYAPGSRYDDYGLRPARSITP